MAAKPRPADGCFEADYPNPNWKPVPCGKAPSAPQMLGRAVGHSPGGPAIVGNTTDYAAVVTGTVASMTGSFDLVKGVTSLTPGTDPTGKITSASNFSLQLNTNEFPTSAFSCGTIAGCQGWEQFLYSNTGIAYIEYSLVGYGNNNCPTTPSPWGSYTIPGTTTKVCYYNTPSTSVPVQPLSNLQNLAVTASAATNGNDAITVVVGPAKSFSKTFADSTLGLAANWNGAEYNLVGDQNATQVNFNPKTVTIAVRVAVDSGIGSTTPRCSTAAYPGTDVTTYVNTFNFWTLESNNLTLARDCATSGNAIVFSQTDGLIITNIAPSTGPATGGTAITVTGNGFTGTSQVTLDLSDAVSSPDLPFTVLSDSTITTTAPACSTLGCGQGAFGKPVTVTTAAGSASSPIGFAPYAYVTGVNPNTGPAGTKITVTGNGFCEYTPNQAFVVGGVPALDVACSPNRNTQCTMTVPAPGGGQVDVQYAGAGGGPFSPTNGNDKFNYVGPTIVSINPTHGPQAGGTPITITGTGFSQQMVAGFGSYYIGITGDCPTITQCSFQTPRWQGNSPVYITVGGAARGSTFSAPVPAAQFTYDAPPPSGTLRPTGGPAAGGTSVEADLTSVKARAVSAVLFHFSTGTVHVDGVVCEPSALNAADAYCVFTSPPVQAGITPTVAVPVSVTEAGNDLPLGSFTYEAPSPGSISPGSGPVAGGTKVTVHVNNLLAGAGAVVNFRFNGTETAVPNAVCTVDAGNTGNSTCTATTLPLPAGETTPAEVPVSVTAQGKSVTVGDFRYGPVATPPTPCEICRENGGTCSTNNGKFVCNCPKSSPTGACQ